MTTNPPIQHRIAESNGIVTQPWIKWFVSVFRSINGGTP